MDKKNCKKTLIGGQAVMEGIMMRGNASMAIAVRDADGDIRLETKRITATPARRRIGKIPVLRGVVNFFSTFVSGIQTLMRSAEVFGEAEPSRLEKWLSEKLKINLMSAVTVISMLLGIALAVVLFIVLPAFLGDVTFALAGLSKQNSALGYSLLVGGYKILVLVCYMLLMSAIKDVRRTFMYHGAEHKTISSYEKGLPLTVENVQKCSTLHNRCGTTFLFFVIFVSVVVFSVFSALLPGIPILQNFAVQTLTRLLLLPLVAGIAYELLKFLAKSDLFIFYPLKLPGLALQKISTRQPDDGMVEVAITAFNAVLSMDEDSSVPEVSFVTPQKPRALVESVQSQLTESQKRLLTVADTEWIISEVTKTVRSGIYNIPLISARNCQKVREMCSKIADGQPLSYVLGYTEFYGYKIKTDARALVPRFETEYVTETALKYISADSHVLDLCCGSGCIAIAVQRQKGCKVTACDISSDALVLAGENAELNGVQIEFCQGDMLNALPENSLFDVIISNPPYIKRPDIATLEKNVQSQPHIALDGGVDGLEFYRSIARDAAKYLVPNGVVVLESGDGMAADISDIMEKAGFKSEIVKDIDGVDRILVCRFFYVTPS